MRVYLPATSTDLAKLGETLPDGKLFDLSSREGHAVTTGLAKAHSDWDQDELEWAAFLAATDDAAALLVADPDAAPIRVVISAEVSASAISESGTDSYRPICAVNLAPAATGEIAAIHVDEPATAPLIVELRKNPDSASAQRNVQDADLLWYAPTEAADIPIPH